MVKATLTGKVPINPDGSPAPVEWGANGQTLKRPQSNTAEKPQLKPQQGQGEPGLSQQNMDNIKQESIKQQMNDVMKEWNNIKHKQDNTIQEMDNILHGKQPHPSKQDNDSSGPARNDPQSNLDNSNKASPLMNPNLQALYNSNGDPAAMAQSAQNYQNSPSGQLFQMQGQAAAAQVQQGAPEQQQAAEAPRVQQSGPSIG